MLHPEPCHWKSYVHVCIYSVNTYPVLEVTAPVLQQVLKLYSAVSYKIVVPDGGIMENSHLYLPAITNVGDKFIVPSRTVGLLLGRGLPDPGVVHIEGDVRVQQKGLWPGTHRMPQRPRRGFQIHRLADLDFQQAIENHHGWIAALFPGSNTRSTHSHREGGREVSPINRRAGLGVGEQGTVRVSSPGCCCYLWLFSLCSCDTQWIHLFSCPCF